LRRVVPSNSSLMAHSLRWNVGWGVRRHMCINCPPIGRSFELCWIPSNDYRTRLLLKGRHCFISLTTWATYYIVQSGSSSSSYFHQLIRRRIKELEIVLGCHGPHDMSGHGRSQQRSSVSSFGTTASLPCLRSGARSPSSPGFSVLCGMEPVHLGFPYGHLSKWTWRTVLLFSALQP
jgi:hypothetical protein